MATLAQLVARARCFVLWFTGFSLHFSQQRFPCLDCSAAMMPVQLSDHNLGTSTARSKFSRKNCRRQVAAQQLACVSWFGPVRYEASDATQFSQTCQNTADYKIQTHSGCSLGCTKVGVRTETKRNLPPLRDPSYGRHSKGKAA